jgi:hypothetical protein
MHGLLCSAGWFFTPDEADTSAAVVSKNGGGFMAMSLLKLAPVIIREITCLVPALTLIDTIVRFKGGGG